MSSNVNITVYNSKVAQDAAERAELAAKKTENATDNLIDPTPPGTQASPAVIPNGPEGRKGKFEPESGFYQGFPEVTEDRRWYFYWSGSSWSLKDMGALPMQPVDGTVEAGNNNAVSGDEVYEKIEYQNFGIRKLVLKCETKKVFYLTYIKSDGVIRIDIFDNEVESYTTANPYYLIGQATTLRQKKGYDPVMFNTINSDIIAHAFINVENRVVENIPESILLNKYRVIKNSVIFTEPDVNNIFINPTFDGGSPLHNKIIKETLASIALSNDYNAKIYLESLFVDKTSKIARFRFKDLNGRGDGIDYPLVDLNLNLTTGDEVSGTIDHLYLQAGVRYSLTVTINTKPILDFMAYTNRNFDFYDKTYNTNVINYIRLGGKLITYYGNDIFSSNRSEQGYLVSNGNSLATPVNNHRWSEYFEVCEGDDVKIISTGNNLVNDTFGYVVCIITYDKNLRKVNRLVGSDDYNFSHIISGKEKYIRFSCASNGLSTFRFSIERKENKAATGIETINALKSIGSRDGVKIGNDIYSRYSNKSILLGSAKQPSLSSHVEEELLINMPFNSVDGTISTTVTKGTLQWVDINDTLYFSANVGYNATLGTSDRTILFYSKDYGQTFHLLYDPGLHVQLTRDWEPLFLFVAENGNILFTRYEDVPGGSSIGVTALWCIKGWKDGAIFDGKDGVGNDVSISRKFKYSYADFVADRPDLDFAQYGQTSWPNYGIPLGSIQGARGRMISGWSYNVYENIIMVTEYGEGDSYWSYKNKLKDQVVDGMHTVVNKTNGLGVSSKAWISFDGGDTFKICFDAHQKQSDGIKWKYCGDAECNHIHAINYNPYNRTFYIVNGDISRSSNMAGYETWMSPNQRILSIPLDRMLLWYSSAPVVSDSETPSVRGYADSLPEWDSIQLYNFPDDKFGHDYFLQLANIEPFPNFTLFSTDSDKNVGFFRLADGELDYSLDCRIRQVDKDVARSHFGGCQQYLRNGMPRIISLATHNTNTVNYIFSCEDGENWKLIYADDNKNYDWGMMTFVTKKGIFVRPSLDSVRVFLLSNKSNY